LREGNFKELELPFDCGGLMGKTEYVAAISEKTKWIVSRKLPLYLVLKNPQS